MRLFTTKLLFNIIVFIIIASSSANSQTFVYTFSGTGTAGLMNGAQGSAQFNNPFGICRGENGVIYIADTENHCIRKIEAGVVSTYAGSTVAGWIDGSLLSARFNEPMCICIDSAGNLYVSDFQGQRIRKISTTGIVSTVAGNGIEGYRDGADSLAQFDYPRGITIDSDGNLYVADSWNHRIRKIDAITNEVSTYAGGGAITGVGTTGGYVDDGDTSARFYTPCGITIDTTGVLYVADAFNHRIRMIDNQRQVTTIAGSGTSGGFSDGPALSSFLNTPTDLFCASNGDLFIGDTYNNRVRRLSQNTLSTIAGNGTAGFINGPSALSEFNYTRAISANVNADSILVIDWNNHAIRLITTPTTAITEAEESLIQIFPNPFNEKINIRVSERIINAKIILSDILGNAILEQNKICEWNCLLETEHLSPGVYFLSIESSEFKINRKVIK
ncbi:MAG: T9SS type A sorting domain-containing protein [Bacteroidia bacterium]|nr:T9SS type A sorting domain-containing protein [Bacteroidia bacterium]